jgi:hypothetical protein
VAGDAPAVGARAGGAWRRIVPWAVAAACFYSAYAKIADRAAVEGITALEYVQRFFSGANWWLWLAVMVPYSFTFFAIDSFAVTRVVSWFNAPVRYRDILPVRGSSYILAILNEQVGKGAMALYLNRRNGVPGWEVGSSMVFIALCELYQLLLFSSIGVALDYSRIEAAAAQPGALPLDVILPVIFAVAAVYAPLHLWIFRAGGASRDTAAGSVEARGARDRRPRLALLERPLFAAFRRARPWHYATLIAIKAPNLLLAVGVYTIALGLFKVDVDAGQMLAFLPVIFLASAIPLPFHAGALVLWQVLFPSYPQVAVFSLIMHTFFVVFNAAIGLLFLPRVNRELFGAKAA